MHPLIASRRVIVKDHDVGPLVRFLWVRWLVSLPMMICVRSPFSVRGLAGAQIADGVFFTSLAHHGSKRETSKCF